MSYDLKNLCSMFETDLDAVLFAIHNGEYLKAKHRVEEMLKSIQKLKDYNVKKEAKPTNMPNGVIE